MAVKQQISANDGTYFITVTCFNWLHLFEITKGYECVYKWFNSLRKNGHYINGYVIMPNHLHALISFSNTGKNINTIVGNGKLFMAYDIVERLQERNSETILTKLSNAVKPSDKKRGKLHEVFEDSFDNKECFTKNSLSKNLITSAGIHVPENGILQFALKITSTVRRVSITKDCKEFFPLIILCR